MTILFLGGQEPDSVAVLFWPQQAFFFKKPSFGIRLLLADGAIFFGPQLGFFSSAGRKFRWVSFFLLPHGSVARFGYGWLSI